MTRHPRTAPARRAPGPPSPHTQRAGSRAGSEPARSRTRGALLGRIRRKPAVTRDSEGRARGDGGPGRVPLGEPTVEAHWRVRGRRGGQFARSGPASAVFTPGPQPAKVTRAPLSVGGGMSESASQGPDPPGPAPQPWRAPAGPQFVQPRSRCQLEQAAARLAGRPSLLRKAHQRPRRILDPREGPGYDRSCLDYRPTCSWAASQLPGVGTEHRTRIMWTLIVMRVLGREAALKPGGSKPAAGHHGRPTAGPPPTSGLHSSVPRL